MVITSLYESNEWSESGDTLNRVVCRAPQVCDVRSQYDHQTTHHFITHSKSFKHLPHAWRTPPVETY
jgi:hypothetical protein